MATLAFLLAATTARAESDDDAVAATSAFLGDGTSIAIGAGPVLSPAYEGAKKLKLGAFPYIKVGGLLNDHLSFSVGRGIAYDFLGRGAFHAGLSLGYSGGRSASDDPHLHGFADISTAVAPSAFVGYEIQHFSFDLNVKDRLGNDPGAEATLSARYSFRPLEHLHLSIGPSITFADRRYEQTFFGVTAAEASRATVLGNPLTAYRATAGAKNASLKMAGFYDLGARWQVTGVLGVSELLGDAGHSPLTQRKLQPEVGLGLLYKF